MNHFVLIYANVKHNWNSTAVSNPLTIILFVQSCKRFDQLRSPRQTMAQMLLYPHPSTSNHTHYHPSTSNHLHSDPSSSTYIHLHPTTPMSIKEESLYNRSGIGRDSYVNNNGCKTFRFKRKEQNVDPFLQKKKRVSKRNFRKKKKSIIFNHPPAIQIDIFLHRLSLRSAQWFGIYVQFVFFFTGDSQLGYQEVQLNMKKESKGNRQLTVQKVNFSFEMNQNTDGVNFFSSKNISRPFYIY